MFTSFRLTLRRFVDRWHQRAYEAIHYGRFSRYAREKRKAATLVPCTIDFRTSDTREPGIINGREITWNDVRAQSDPSLAGKTPDEAFTEPFDPYALAAELGINIVLPPRRDILEVDGVPYRTYIAGTLDDEELTYGSLQ
jgi:hypothetical protein